MLLKGHKKTMMLLLALSLATTSCGKKETNKEDAYAQVQSIMDESENYSEEYYNEMLDNFYNSYLETFGDYMSEKQFNAFLEFVKNVNKDEMYQFKNTFTYLNQIFAVTDNSYGRAFYKTFNSRVLCEYLNYQGESGKGLNFHINTICALVNDKSQLFQSIYSNDINNVIACLMESTNYKNRDNLEELFLKMDLYYDLINAQEYSEQKLAESYEARIREILAEVIEAKKTSDNSFANSLYAKLLTESCYNGKETYLIVPSITTKTFYIDIKEDNDKYTYRIEDLSSDYLDSDYTIEKIKEIKINEILGRSFKLDEEEYPTVEDTMQLIMCLLDSRYIDFTKCQDANEMRQMIYNDLENYFASEDEFNSFFLKLYNRPYLTTEQYFNVFQARISERGIKYEDFIQYLALTNYASKRQNMDIYFPDNDNYATREELAKLKPEECQEIAEVSESTALISHEDYQYCFDKTEAMLADNDLGYEMIYNPEYCLTWQYGTIDSIASNENCVLSSSVEPQSMTYNGTNIVYYEYPEYYENGLAVDSFYNSFNELTVREIDGFRAEITDPETGERRIIFVVDMTKDSKVYPSIRFMENYQIFSNKKEKKESVATISLGGSYE